MQDSFIETDLYTKPTDKHQYLLTSFCHLSKRSILYTPFHFFFAAFALTKTVTYDVLMNIKTALLIAVNTIQRASDVLPRTDALKTEPKKLTATTPYVIT